MTHLWLTTDHAWAELLEDTEMVSVRLGDVRSFQAELAKAKSIAGILGDANDKIIEFLERETAAETKLAAVQAELDKRAPLTSEELQKMREEHRAAHATWKNDVFEARQVGAYWKDRTVEAERLVLRLNARADENIDAYNSLVAGLGALFTAAEQRA